MLSESENQASASPHIIVANLTMGYGDRVLMRDLDFTVDRGDVFAVMGGSGSGKSTLMRVLVGLKAPLSGAVMYGDTDFWSLTEEQRSHWMQRFGILYQSGALWSSLTVAENIGLPMELHTALDRSEIRERVQFKLSLVGLDGYQDFYPSQISGGMRKRAGLARAIALDPEILFFDEPSAGLDPVNAKQLDDLILEINRSLKATVVLVTHELSSIFAIANNAVFLDLETRTASAKGNPKAMLASTRDPNVARFLTRDASHCFGNDAKESVP